MERWSLCTSVVTLLLLLTAASHGRELPIKNSGHSFIYNHTLAKTLVEYASAVYMTDLTELFTWTCSRCNDLTQVWVQDSDGNITDKICDDSGEDPDCCRCISMFSLRIQDHFTYLGVDMQADDWSICRIITAESVRKQFRQELASNIIMTKHDIDVSIVEPSVQTDRISSS